LIDANAQYALAFLFMDIDSCFKIGWVLKPHGLKGEVTVTLDDNAPEDFSGIKSVFLEQNNRLVPYFIHGISAQGKKAFVKFEDINSLDDATKISKQSVYIEKSFRPKSVRGEFYDDEIIDFEVHDEEKGLLGKIREVMQAGPNRLLVVDYNNKEILIPVNGPFIESVNKAKKKISVNLPEGFLEL
jgi:16S rRNA processing protein RimM